MALLMPLLPGYDRDDPSKPRLRPLTATIPAAVPNVLPALRAATAPASLVANPSPSSNPFKLLTFSANPNGAPMARVQRINDAAPAAQTPDLGGDAAPALGPVPVPNVQRQASDPAQRLNVDQGELQRLQQGDGISHLNSRWARGFARAGDEALSLLAPGVASLTPGTHLHNMQLQHEAAGRIAQDEGEQKSAADLVQQQAQTGLTDAQTQYNLARPDIEQAKLDQRENAVRERVSQAAAGRGQIVKWGEDGLPSFTDDINSEAYKEHVSATALHDANAEKARILGEIQQKHYMPGTPEFAEAQKKIALQEQKMGIAAQNLGLRAQGLQVSRNNYMANNYGVGPDGQALPGSMLTEDGTPVGSHFAANVRPTGQERTKADMANSAAEQIETIKGIVRNHPTLFGPGYGQASAFKQWLGSQDPDAQRFVAARTIAGDHLAGTFGGRSEAALQSLDKALGEFKDNPAAMEAGLDQLTKANSSFQRAGTVHTAPGRSKSTPQGAPPPPPPTSHAFSAGAWQRANPSGDINAAVAAAKQQGYTVVQ